MKTTKGRTTKIAPLPKIETPEERGARYARTRQQIGNYDDTVRLMFEQDARAMKAARPEWSAERVAQELRDRGYGSRQGYAWTVRTAAAALSA